MNIVPNGCGDSRSLAQSRASFEVQGIFDGGGPVEKIRTRLYQLVHSFGLHEPDSLHNVLLWAAENPKDPSYRAKIALGCIKAAKFTDVEHFNVQMKTKDVTNILRELFDCGYQPAEMAAALCNTAHEHVHHGKYALEELLIAGEAGGSFRCSIGLAAIYADQVWRSQFAK